MNFLNVGPWELVVILIIAILLVGPKRMVEIARTIGRATSQLRRLSNEFTSTIQNEILASDREMRQTSESTIEDITGPIASIRAELEATGQETRQALEDIAESEAGPIAGIQAELQATERETRQMLENSIEDDQEQETK